MRRHFPEYVNLVAVCGGFRRKEAVVVRQALKSFTLQINRRERCSVKHRNAGTASVTREPSLMVIKPANGLPRPNRIRRECATCHRRPIHKRCHHSRIVVVNNHRVAVRGHPSNLLLTPGVMRLRDPVCVECKPAFAPWRSTRLVRLRHRPRTNAALFLPRRPRFADCRSSHHQC